MPLEFDHYPKLTELFPNIGGSPAGFDYAFVTLERVPEAEQEGWSQLNRGSTFHVTGPKGDIHLMPMGAGEPLPGFTVAQCAPKVFVDTAAEEATGLPIDETEEPLVKGPDEPKLVKGPKK